MSTKVVTAESLQAVLQLIASDIKAKADSGHVHSDYVTTTVFNQAISGINSFNIQVVSNLPTDDINDHTIYLKSIEGEDGNKHEEYMYINGEWELIGTTEIDLSSYVTNDVMARELEGKADADHAHDASEIKWSSTIAATTQTTVKQAIEAIHAHTEVELGKKANSADIPTKVSYLDNDKNYTTASDVDTKIANAVTGGQIDLSSYVTEEELRVAMLEKADDEHEHEEYIKTTDIEYSTTSEASTMWTNAKA